MPMSALRCAGFGAWDRDVALFSAVNLQIAATLPVFFTTANGRLTNALVMTTSAVVPISLISASNASVKSSGRHASPRPSAVLAWVGEETWRRERSQTGHSDGAGSCPDFDNSQRSEAIAT